MPLTHRLHTAIAHWERQALETHASDDGGVQFVMPHDGMILVTGTVWRKYCTRNAG